MNRRHLIIAVGLVGCTVLGVTWFRMRQHTREVAAQRASAEAAAPEFKARAGRLQSEIATAEAEIARVRETHYASLTPVERARQAVSPLVMRLKAAHELNPPPPRPPLPPYPPMGMAFPELMGDLEYTRSYAVILRGQQERNHLPVLKKLGVTKEAAARVIDLLTEREMIAADFRSLTDNGGLPGPMAQQRKILRDEVDAKIRDLLGEELFDGLKEDIVDHTTIVHPDKSVTRETRVRREIPEFRRLSYQLFPLEQRLSYSAAPLTEEQKSALRDWIAKNSTSGPPRNDAFLEAAPAMLQPEQQFAVDELKVESEALQKRNKLPRVAPKSSG